MAEQLHTTDVIEVLPGVTQAAYLKWHNELDELDSAVASALADRKEKLAQIKADIGAKDDFAAFKRARKDREMSGESRERRELSYRRQMAWLQKPVGFQATMDLAPDASAEIVQFNVAALKQIDQEGEAAGRNGRHRHENPYTPGTEQAVRWDNAWLRGQATIADTLSPSGPPLRRRARLIDHDEPANDAVINETPAPRRRGRPPGSKNKPKEQQDPLLASAPPVDEPAKDEQHVDEPERVPVAAEDRAPLGRYH